MTFQATRSFATKLDREDPLVGFRAKFFIPRNSTGSEVLYFCGNSLGLQPRNSRALLEEEMLAWETLGVEGHFKENSPWVSYHELVREPISKLVGALPSEVVSMNSLTVNLHLLFVSFYRPNAKRHKILIEGSAFPSDQYAVKSQLMYHGYDPRDALIEIFPRDGERILRMDDIVTKIEETGDSIAIVFIGGVNYSTGQVVDMKRITEAGHKAGCRVGFDLAHAIGNIPMNLHDWKVDFAVWCTYKYLNAGPGAIGGCFIHEQNCHDPAVPRFSGWWGHDKASRFKMGPDFTPIPGAEGWQLSNPSITSIATLRSSLEIFDEVGVAKLRQKSQGLTSYMEFLIESLADPRVSIITPKNPLDRGCQLSIVVDGIGKKIFEKLMERGVICDWREPDIIRVAPVPLYNTFEEVYKFYKIFKGLLLG